MNGCCLPRHLVATLSVFAGALLGCELPVDSEDTARPLEERPLQADIDADTDRDGDIDADDEDGEDEHAAKRGAIVLANIDDDDGDGVRDSRDARLEDDVDTALVDLTPVTIKRVLGLKDHTVRLSVGPPEAQSRIRIWRIDDEGPSIVFEPRPDDRMPTDVDLTGADRDVGLAVEALVPRTSLWDGRMILTLHVLEGDVVLSEDVLVLRVGPVLFPDNLQAPQRIFVMNIPSGSDRNGAFLTAMNDALPEGTSLSLLSSRLYEDDRWVQDTMELGYQMRPTGAGPHMMATAMQHERGTGGLEPFVPEGYLGVDQGYVYLGGAESSLNYGGNLEVSPPVEGFPFGRLLYGAGSAGTVLGRPHADTMNAEQVGFLDAQEAQGPALALSSEWLFVGHIDEIFQFVPDLTPDEGGKEFKVVFASPALARDVLLAVQARGGGDLAVFEGRRRSFSVDEILGAEEFMALNEAVQGRIDSVKETLMDGLGLTENDVVEVPVLFEDVSQGFVAAFNPGIQNLVTVGNRLFVPDPEGPTEGNSDAWQEATRVALAATDLDVVFVDVFRSYHELFGEAHCGTNVERAPYAPWWQAQGEDE